jgi:hypothetical protein
MKKENKRPREIDDTAEDVGRYFVAPSRIVSLARGGERIPALVVKTADGTVYELTPNTLALLEYNRRQAKLEVLGEVRRRTKRLSLYTENGDVWDVLKEADVLGEIDQLISEEEKK